MSCVRETEESNESTKEISAGGIFRVSIDGVLPSAFTNVEWSVESTNKQMRIECMATNGLQAIFKVAKTSGHGEAHVWARLPVECADACRSSDEHIGVASIKATIAADAVAGQDAGHEPGVATESGTGRVYMF